jgi:hypothetical protein
MKTFFDKEIRKKNPLKKALVDNNVIKVWHFFLKTWGEGLHK